MSEYTMCKPGCPKKAAYHPKCSVVQRARKEMKVTGITHLIRKNSGSLFNGSVMDAAYHGEHLEIDDADILLSRRGPNMELHAKKYAGGTAAFPWFGVLTFKERSFAPSSVYIRKDTIISPDVPISEFPYHTVPHLEKESFLPPPEKRRYLKRIRLINQLPEI